MVRELHTVAAKMLEKTVLFLILVYSQALSNAAVLPSVEDSWETDIVSRDSRVASGWEAYLGQFPYHVSLRVLSSGSVGVCGGSLISREWVLTAAHCPAGRDSVIIRVGVTDLSTPLYIMESFEWYSHPSYDDARPTTVQVNDIGLVKMPQRVVYNEYIQPIRIQSSADAHRSYANETLIFTGHGRNWTDGPMSQVLQWVYMRGISDLECRSTYPSSTNVNSICAIWYNVTSQSPCAGDNGGPLVHVNGDGERVVIGINIFRSGSGCHLGRAAGFVRPGPFHSWFQEVTGINFENVVEDEDEFTTLPPEEHSTTVLPTTDGSEDEYTTSPSTTEKPDDSTDPPSVEESQEDSDELDLESSEESKEDSDSSSEDVSDSGSEERPFGSIIKKKKLEMDVNFKVKIKKASKVKKIPIRRKHRTHAKVHLALN